eukprot:CAMPEP_0194031474 /NCGR_PEP_ID=MMETSP0009_2-20130614/4638_1 /TAXON_ID=210454 /ORGANISM="Grammatophora oceanica, Strain CCMP 410" /LENGTH=69 /DNA_ID=CAMNT_0038671633 /DNA_START=556 /DNA_END=762 /DNA_ORIENTATION=+
MTPMLLFCRCMWWAYRTDGQKGTAMESLLRPKQLGYYAGRVSKMRMTHNDDDDDWTREVICYGVGVHTW